MRDAPTAQSAPSRPFIEVRVRFPARLTNATRWPNDVPLARAKPLPPKAVPAQPPPAAPEPRVAEPAPELQADREQLDAVVAALREQAAGLRADQADRLRGWQQAAVELAALMATRLLHERVTTGEFPVEAKVRDMAAQFGEAGVLTVRLNPDDLALLERRLGGEPLLPGQDDPKVVADAALDRGRCQLDGRETTLVSDLTSELQEIRDELLRSLVHARA